MQNVKSFGKVFFYRFNLQYLANEIGLFCNVCALGIGDTRFFRVCFYDFSIVTSACECGNISFNDGNFPCVRTIRVGMVRRWPVGVPAEVSCVSIKESELQTSV